jgi:hypothetical protein
MKSRSKKKERDRGQNKNLGQDQGLQLTSMGTIMATVMIIEKEKIVTIMDLLMIINKIIEEKENEKEKETEKEIETITIDTVTIVIDMIITIHQVEDLLQGAEGEADLHVLVIIKTEGIDIN